MDGYKVVGIKKVEMTEGKNKGKTACTYHFESAFTDYDLDNAVCHGVRTISEFTYKDFGVTVGDTVTLVYEKGFQDRAVLVNVIPFASANQVKSTNGK